MHSLNKLLFPSFKGLALIITSLSFLGLGLSPCLLSAATLDDLEFTLINNDTEYSVSAKGSTEARKAISGALTIPGSYNGKPVTEMSSLGAFDGCTELTSIDLSNTALTSIEHFAFNQCTSLSSIDFPDTLTSIEYYSFNRCTSLTSIDLSNTAITSIGNYAFNVCNALASINLPDTLTSIGNESFFKCTSLKSVDLSNTAITSLGYHVFQGCTKLESIDFPDTLTSIKDDAFLDCTKLAAITFQGSAPALEGDSIFLNTGSDVGGFTITIYKEHEASYASWRDVYTFNVMDNPTTGPVILVLQTSYDPSNQAFNIITKGEDSASNMSLQHTANLGDAWATLSALTYSTVSNSTNDTITRTVTLDPSTESTGFYRLVSANGSSVN